MSSSTRKAQKKQKRLNEQALTFVVRRQGRLNAKAMSSFSDKMAGKSVSRKDAEQALHDAVQSFSEGEARLYICGGSSCRKQKLPGEVRKAVKKQVKQDALSVETTRCLGPCGHAPVAVARVGTQSCFFSDLREEKPRTDFLALLQQINGHGTRDRSGTNGSMTATPHVTPAITPAPAPVAALIEPLQPLGFLVGTHLSRTPADSGLVMHQHLTGEVQAEGHLLTLSIRERFGDDEASPHQASFVTIEWNDSTRQIEARVFSSHCHTFQAAVLIEGNRIIIPDHRPLPVKEETLSAQRVFVIEETATHQVLEISRGAGPFEPLLSLNRLNPSAGK